MIDNIRQKKINEVIGRILAGLAYDQHINGTPITFSVGVREGTDMISNVIVLHEAPYEIVRDLGYLKDRFPGVEITQKQGGIWIDCEHIVLARDRKAHTLSGKLRKLAGCVV